jgi:hypothetical protein
LYRNEKRPVELNDGAKEEIREASGSNLTVQNNTSSNLGIQARKLSLHDCARRNLARRDKADAAKKSIQFRKSVVLAVRRQTARKASAGKGFQPVEASDLSGAPLVTVSQSPNPSTSLSTSTPSSPLTKDQMLQRIRDVRACYRSHEIQAKSAATKAKNREQAERERECEANRLQPAWAKAGDLHRGRAYMAAILDTGMAATFTLNFSPKVLEAAGKAKEGSFHNLRSRITRELKKALGDSPSLACGLDSTTSGRLHIHGALVLDPSRRSAVVAALLRAGGKWASKRGQEHQLHMQSDQWSLTEQDFLDVQRPLDAGWSGYLLKMSKRLRKATNHSVLYASPKLKRDAELQYNADRALQIRAKKGDKSINIDFIDQNTLSHPIYSDSQIGINRVVINHDQGSSHENADRKPRILRDPLAGHARHGCPARQATHANGRASRPWAAQLHAARRHDRRRGADPPIT